MDEEEEIIYNFNDCGHYLHEKCVLNSWNKNNTKGNCPKCTKEKGKEKINEIEEIGQTSNNNNSFNNNSFNQINEPRRSVSDLGITKEKNIINKRSLSDIHDIKREEINNNNNNKSFFDGIRKSLSNLSKRFGTSKRSFNKNIFESSTTPGINFGTPGRNPTTPGRFFGTPGGIFSTPGRFFSTPGRILKSSTKKFGDLFKKSKDEKKKENLEGYDDNYFKQ